MVYNEDIVSTWGVFVTSHIGYEIKFVTLYKYELLLTMYTCFKVVMAF